MIGCTTLVITPLGGFGGSPLKSRGTNLVVTILWKGVFNNKFNGISTSMSTITNFLAPKLIGIAFKPI
jgi:hypothetical protein